jgi:hypothetical protein
MSKKRMSKLELMEEYIESRLASTIPMRLAKAVERHIPYVPKEKQDKMSDFVSDLRKKPESLFDNTGDKDNDMPDIPIDENSLSYQRFAGLINELADEFDNDYEAIKRNFIKAYAAEGITLLID